MYTANKNKALFIYIFCQQKNTCTSVWIINWSLWGVDGLVIRTTMTRIFLAILSNTHEQHNEILLHFHHSLSLESKKKVIFVKMVFVICKMRSMVY